MTNEERIRQRAYELWEAEGRPASREIDHWYEAREEMAGKALGAATYKATQQGSVVTVAASGNLPRHRMRASLEINRLEADDPDNAGAFFGYMLLFRQMGPIGEAGPVPFKVTASLEYRGTVSKVLVFDRHGPHIVKVGRPRASTAKPARSVLALKSPARKSSRS
jgi:hypothetical protein